jgi:hypothetical protein
MGLKNQIWKRKIRQRRWGNGNKYHGSRHRRQLDGGKEDDRDTALSVDHEADLHYIPGWVFDLYIALGEGHVKETHVEMLRQRFKEVLTVTTHIVE